MGFLPVRESPKYWDQALTLPVVWCLPVPSAVALVEDPPVFWDQVLCLSLFNAVAWRCPGKAELRYHGKFQAASVD